MNLIEKSEKIYKEIDALKDNKTLVSNAAKFNNFSSLLTPIYDVLVELEESLEIFIQNKIQVPANTGINKSIVKVEDFKKKFNENSEIVLNPFPDKNQKNYFFSPLEETSESLKVNMKLSWKNWVSNKMKSDINPQAFESLKKISAYKIEIAQLEQNYGKFNSIAENLPKNEDVIQSVEELIEKIDGIWGKLHKIPEIVVDFLVMASGIYGASYSEFSNPEVKEWLENNGDLLNSIKISL